MGDRFNKRVIYSQFVWQFNHHARRRFSEWAENEIAVVPDFHKRILFSDEAHFWLNGYVNKQNCRIWNMFHMTTTTGEERHSRRVTNQQRQVQHVRMYGGYFSADRIFQFRQT
ncbi:hypothetical protein TNCV_3438381 [Trichonephila clavipes]|nr:hypothetical protein TNCV_3438381 [Trichonephila clavipes]